MSIVSPQSRTLRESVNRADGCGDASHTDTPDVVTVHPKRSMASDHYMRSLYRGGLNTAEIADKLRNTTEAEVYNAVFGRPFNGATP